MDPATHTLAGLCLAGSLPRRLRGRDVTVTVVAASLLPDIDVVWSLAEPATAALNRHVLTHSLLGMAVLSVGFGALAWLVARRRLRLHTYVALAAAGVVGHIVLDLINAFGVVLLYPWSTQRFELPLAFILDPVLTGILLAGLFVPWLARNRELAAVSARTALFAAGCYLALSFGLRSVADTMLAVQAAASGSEGWTYLVPEPGSPLRWTGLYRDGVGYRQTIIYPLTGRTVAFAFVHSDLDVPLVTAARTTPDGRRVEAFFRAPVWRAQGETVVGYDLRFRFPSLGNNWDPFGFCFRRQGDRFVLLHQDLGSYLTDWVGATLTFGLSTPTHLWTTPSCPSVRQASVERSGLGSPP